MGRYFVRGIDPAGKRRSERVPADSAAQAFATLTAQGWRELELLSDAIFASAGTPASEASRPLVEAFYAPDEELAFSRYGVWWQLWMAVKKGGWILLLLAGWLLWRRATGKVFDGWEVTFWLFLLFALLLALYFHWSTGRYKRLVAASSAGRWQEVLRRVSSLERSGIGRLIIPSEFAFRRAGALHGLGRGAEALEVLARADRTGTPDWSFEARLGDFHARCNRLDEAHACYQRSAAMGSEHADAHLSLAEFLAGFQARDPAAARAALARARELPIATNLEWAVLRIEAMIAVEEGRFAEAIDHLARSRAAYLRIADSGLRGLFLAHYAAYAAIALGGLDRREEARQVLVASRAEQWLRPHAPGLIDRAQGAAGMPPAGDRGRP